MPAKLRLSWPPVEHDHAETEIREATIHGNVVLLAGRNVKADTTFQSAARIVVRGYGRERIDVGPGIDTGGCVKITAEGIDRERPAGCGSPAPPERFPVIKQGQNRGERLFDNRGL